MHLYYIKLGVKSVWDLKSKNMHLLFQTFTHCWNENTIKTGLLTVHFPTNMQLVACTKMSAQLKICKKNPKQTPPTLALVKQDQNRSILVTGFWNELSRIKAQYPSVKVIRLLFSDIVFVVLQQQFPVLGYSNEKQGKHTPEDKCFIYWRYKVTKIRRERETEQVRQHILLALPMVMLYRHTRTHTC